MKKTAKGPFVVIGAGGHAKVVLDALLCAGTPAAAIELFDDDAQREGDKLFGIEVRYWGSAVQTPCGSRIHVAIGNNAAREAAYLRAIETGGHQGISIVHPAATLAMDVAIGATAFVAACAVVGPYARVGTGCIINHSAVVDHDCTVDDWAHVAPGAILGGAASVGSHSLIGAGAVVLPGVRVGHRCTVGAGAVVIEDVPDGSTVIGVPARPN